MRWKAFHRIWLNPKTLRILVLFDSKVFWCNIWYKPFHIISASGFIQCELVDIRFDWGECGMATRLNMCILCRLMLAFELRLLFHLWRFHNGRLGCFSIFSLLRGLWATSDMFLFLLDKLSLTLGLPDSALLVLLTRGSRLLFGEISGVQEPHRLLMLAILLQAGCLMTVVICGAHVL